MTPDDLRRLARALGLYVLRDRVNPEELASRLPSLEILVFPEGSEILREGADGIHLYILSRGYANVSRAGHPIARLAAGDMFGEVSGSISGAFRPRSATVTAGEGCEVFRCEARGFADLVAQHPELIEAMRNMGTARMRRPSP